MPIKYVPFVPEPIEGQAVLNFNRVLKYKGVDDTSMTLQRGMPLYEVEDKENKGEKHICVGFNYSLMDDFLSEWMKKKEELASGKITREEYFEWKIKWPHKDK